MRATRRVYALALGVTALVLVGSVAGAAAFAASSGTAGVSGSSRSADWGSGPGQMMGGWDPEDSDDAPEVTLDQAKELADQWVARNQPGATADAGFTMPMGYLFTVSRNGGVVTRIVVSEDTGRVFAGRPGRAGAGGAGMMGQGWTGSGGGMMGGFFATPGGT